MRTDESPPWRRLWVYCRALGRPRRSSVKTRTELQRLQYQRIAVLARPVRNHISVSQPKCSPAGRVAKDKLDDPVGAIGRGGIRTYDQICPGGLLLFRDTYTLRRCMLGSWLMRSSRTGEAPSPRPATTSAKVWPSSFLKCRLIVEVVLLEQLVDLFTRVVRPLGAWKLRFVKIPHAVRHISLANEGLDHREIVGRTCPPQRR
jgi:hypothetical protein